MKPPAYNLVPNKVKTFAGPVLSNTTLVVVQNLEKTKPIVALDVVQKLEKLSHVAKGFAGVVR